MSLLVQTFIFRSDGRYRKKKVRMKVHLKNYGITLTCKWNTWALPLHIDFIGIDYFYIQFLCFGFTWYRP